jgi:hypothetical protein
MAVSGKGVKAYNSLDAQSPRYATTFRSLLNWPYARIMLSKEGLLGFGPAGFQGSKGRTSLAEGPPTSALISGLFLQPAPGLLSPPHFTVVERTTKECEEPLTGGKPISFGSYAVSATTRGPLLE